jgi:hypothetical protein
MSQRLDPNVWGPHFWFFLMTIAISYPTKANEVTKKKYYDLITNFPLFIPHDKIGNKFSQMIDKYPVTPYLDGKDAFIKWVHYIHNKINEELGKDSVLFTEALNTYYEKYKPKEIRLRDEMRYRRKLIISVLIVILIIGAYYLYKK